MPSLPPRAPIRVTLTAWTAGLLVGTQVASKASRDALFLATFDATLLPWAMLTSAGASLLGVLAFSRLVKVLGPGRVLPGTCVLSALLFLAEWAMVGTHPQATAWLLYLHVATLGALLVSGLWSIFSELFNPNDARRFVGRIGAGGTLGGISGGLLVERISVSFSVDLILPLVGALHLVAAALMARLGKDLGPAADEPRLPVSGLGGLRTIHQSRNLRWIAVFVALLALTAALADFAFKATVSGRGGEQELMSFFAFYYAAVSLLTFFVQSLLTDKSLSRLGLAGTLALLPGAQLLLALLAVGMPSIGSTTGLRGTGATLENSLHRSSYELLYTPLSKEARRATKTFLDVAVARLGDALGSVLVLGCVAWLPTAAPRAATGLAVGAAGLALALVSRLHRGYVTALAESLRSGVVEADSLPFRDATTLRTIAETTMALDRERLLQEIERFRSRELTSPGAEDDERSRDAQQAEATEGSNAVQGQERPQARRSQLSEWLSLLLADDPAAFRSRADEMPFPAELAAMLLSRLDERSWERTVQDVLTELAPRITGLLGDVLLAEEAAPALRRRVPALLVHRPHARGVECLLCALHVARFDVRYRCAQALVAIQRAEPQLVRPPAPDVHQLVLKELKRASEGDAGTASLPPSSPRELAAPARAEYGGDPGSRAEPSVSAESEWLEGRLQRRLHRRVELVFLLLSLVHDRSPLARCLTALSGEDEAARGTALEYLDNILPPEVRLALEPHLDPVRRREQRSSVQ